ncbi:MAG: hypothetical protein AAFR52_21185, partial [Pseudomonadota bacterium]
MAFLLLCGGFVCLAEARYGRPDRGFRHAGVARRRRVRPRRLALHHARRPLQIAAAITGAALLAVSLVVGVFAAQVHGPSDPLVALVQSRLACLPAHSVAAAGRPAARYLRVRRDAVCDAHDRLPLATPYGDPQTAIRVARAFGTLEGRWQESDTLFGHDLAGPVRLLAATVLPIARGGSSPLLTAFESVSGNSAAILRPDPDDGWYEGAVKLLTALRTKWRNAVAASQFVRESLPDDAARAHFISGSLAVVTRRGPELAGEAGARALLGERPPESLLDVCLVAAAMGRPFPRGWTPDGVRRFWHARADGRASYWERLLSARVRPCIRRSTASAIAKAEALAATEGMPFPFVRPAPGLSGSARTVARDALRAGNLGQPLRLSVGLDLERTMRTDQAMARRVDGAFRRVGARRPADLRSTLAVAEVMPDALLLRAAHVSHHGDLLGPVGG